MDAANAAPVAQLCFGTGASELNLRVVQQRVAELIRIIDSLLIEMQTHMTHWTGFLDKLAVINMTHAQIMGELRPLLKQYTVYPKFVDNPGIEHAIPDMLASRLLPEQVEEEAAFKAAMPGGLTQLAAEPKLCLSYADDRVRELQELINWLTNVQHIVKAAEADINPTPIHLPVGVLDPKSKGRRELEATSREIVKAAAAAEKGREQAGTTLLQAPPQPPSLKRRKPDPSAAEAPAALTVPTTEEEADVLIAKVMAGELWPSY